MCVCFLFTAARTWKQPRCPMTDEWVKKLWHIYTGGEYYSAIKRSASDSVLTRWMSLLEAVLQSGVSQKDRERQMSHISAIHGV